MASVEIHFDFRPFINRMRYNGEQIEKSVTSEDVREAIIQEIALKTLASKGHDSGATDTSLAAVFSGSYVADEPHKSAKNGATRYANGSIGPKGIYLDPVDEYEHHYGTKSIKGWDKLSEYNIKNDPDAYAIIYEAILNAIGG